MTTRRLAAMLAVLTVSTLLLAPTSEAVPSRASIQAELDKLAKQIAVLDEEHNVARIRLTELERQIRDVQRTKTEADARTAVLREAASQRAAAVYRVGLPDVLITFLTSRSVGDFLQRMTVVSKVGDWESGVMTDLQIANERSDERAEKLSADLARATALKASIASKRDQLEAAVKQQRALLDRIAAQETAAARVKRAAPKPAPPPISLPGSGGARIAVQTAYDQIGKPYEWAASGPDSFDCSGLTMYAWRAAGISLPHSSRAQFSATKRVAREDLQPGDLVFFGNPIHHVGIYVGNGNMINAPETGDYVGVRSMARRDYVGAGRPGV